MSFRACVKAAAVAAADAAVVDDDAYTRAFLRTECALTTECALGDVQRTSSNRS